MFAKNFKIMLRLGFFFNISLANISILNSINFSINWKELAKKDKSSYLFPSQQKMKNYLITDRYSIMN
ncbi:hypothetical protein BpHYR1_014505 [Brachionus plicatilis]|uniref:Uncharacterized protein n=1 Tax=Brachionus plicatilis TaxID=10195 RepID=A0A3M7QG04_BRAPC|nr:hypothetical protein BpHYR1_014505 [Brachionus plicatilis]